MNKRDLLKSQKSQLAKKFKSRCYVCRKPFGKYFVFHHIYYVDGEPFYKDFKDSTDYQLAVIPFVKKNTPQFLLLCKAHHHLVEWRRSIKDMAMWRRFCLAGRMK